MTESSERGIEHRSLDARPAVEDYFPSYVDSEEVEFDFCYWECPCGWRSDDLQHPSMVYHYRDGHHDFGLSPDCGLGKSVMVFADGTTAEVRV